MKRIICSIIFILFSLTLSGLDLKVPLQQSMHTVWTTKNGLPSDSINDIFQDHNGYIWIGTFNGLVRFDGINFFTYSKYEDRGFESNSVTTLILGKDHEMWIGTNGEGIARYKNNTFEMFNSSELKNNIIKSLSVDRSGNLWIGSGNGLLKLDQKGKISLPLGGFFNGTSIEMIYREENGQLWISTSTGGVSVYSNEKRKNIPLLDKIGNVVVTSVLKDKNNDIWIGTKNDGLYLIKNKSLLNFSHYKDFQAKTITSLWSDKTNCMWIGTDSGLFRYYNNKFCRYSEDNGLSNNQVSDVLEDKEGNLWIATSRGGINKLSNGKFISLTTKQGLIHDKVNSIFQESENVFWIGTDGGLSILKNRQFVRQKITDYLKGIRIRHINKDSRGKFWISTYSDLGLVTFMKGRIKNYTSADGLTSDRCRISIEDHKGNIWIGTSNGLNNINRKSVIKTFSKKDGLSNEYILSITEDSEKNLWITTNGGGISIWKDGVFKTLNVKDGLNSNIVFRIYEDSEKIKWLSTSRGLSIYSNNRFYNFTKQSGLPEIAIFQVIEDRRGNLWMVSESGIFIAKRSDLIRIAENKLKYTKVTLYNNLDGLLDSPTPVSWAIQSNKGVNLFPTLMGVALIDTLNIPLNEKPPPLLIEFVRIDNKKLPPLQIKILSPNYKRLTFAYTALSYVIPHKVQYNYKLEGFDEDWSGLTTEREVSYTTLPPGKYIFRVKAVNNDGVWNSGNVKMEFLQKPFFYKTLWFNIFILIIVIGIIAFLLGLRIRTLRRRGIELEKQVAERTEELETTDRIVANINKEIDFDKLLSVLLNQTMILFPQAEKGVILTYDRSLKKFVHHVSRGYEDITKSGIQLSFNDAFDRYVKCGEEYDEGIYVHHKFTKNSTKEITPKIDIPESMIAMTITFGKDVDGFFILENMTNPEAFTRSDAKKLMRVREHAISAVFKARTRQKLEEAAIMDPLTKLHNRRKMIEVLNSELIRSERTDQPFCIVMCDIDHFKKFNDTHGHDCGDFVLIEISKLIRSTIRKQDFVGRWGGEEFLFVYPETNIEGGKIVTEKVRSVIANSVFDFKGIILNITMTFGVAVYSEGKTIDSVIKDADDLLYLGKQKGRNCVI